MPRYFFHVAGPETFVDDAGIELPDGIAAWSEAVKSCGELLRDLSGRMPDRSELVLRVEDEARQTVAELCVSAAWQRMLPSSEVHAAPPSAMDDGT